MREHATRHIALVVLLLCAVAVVARHWETVTAASQQEQAVRIYLPFVPVQETPTEDLMIDHLGLYQSVQDQSNGVTLVARKPAMLRVHARSVRPDGNPSRAAVTVQAWRDGQSLGTLTIGPQTVSLRPSADDLGSTFNIDLPLEWLQGSISLKVAIDREGAVPEWSETNNTMTADFSFREVPALELTIVPITYIDTVTGVTFTETAHDPISGWLLSVFPLNRIDVTLRAPYTFRGDLRRGDEWTRLLGELTTIWAAEAGPGSSRLYFGLVPNSAPGGRNWFSGGVSGLGWVGQRVSVGLDVDAETGKSAAHEIGHNLGRQHAPCGNPNNVDPNFPYPNASIGVIGVDTGDDTLLNPNVTHDVMSYCGPEWVSDYTYEGLFRDQALRAGRAGADKGEGWLLSALIDGDAVTALPIQRIDRPFMPVETDAAYRVQLLDGRGNVIASYPAELYQADEEGASARMLMAHVPGNGIDGSGPETLRYLGPDGQIVAEQSVAESAEQ